VETTKAAEENSKTVEAAKEERQKKEAVESQKRREDRTKALRDELVGEAAQSPTNPQALSWFSTDSKSFYQAQLKEFGNNPQAPKNQWTYMGGRPTLPLYIPDPRFIVSGMALPYSSQNIIDRFSCRVYRFGATSRLERQCAKIRPETALPGRNNGTVCTQGKNLVTRLPK
jgi:hypothetical protein